MWGRACLVLGLLKWMIICWVLRMLALGKGGHWMLKILGQGQSPLGFWGWLVGEKP